MQGSWAKLILQQEGQDKGCWRSTDEALTLQPGCPHWPANQGQRPATLVPHSLDPARLLHGGRWCPETWDPGLGHQGELVQLNWAEWAFSCCRWWTSVSKVVWPAPDLKQVMHDSSPGIPHWLTKKQPTSCAVHPTAAPAPPLKPSQVGMERRKEYLLPPRGKPHPSNHFLFLSGVHVVQLLSRVWLFVTPTAHQAPLSMGFSRQEYWGGSPCARPGDLPDPGIEPAAPALAGGFITLRQPWSRSL